MNHRNGLQESQHGPHKSGLGVTFLHGDLVLLLNTNIGGCSALRIPSCNAKGNHRHTQIKSHLCPTTGSLLLLRFAATMLAPLGDDLQASNNVLDVPKHGAYLCSDSACSGALFLGNSTGTSHRRHRPLLRILDLSHCDIITDVSALAALTHLESLTLSHCDIITDVSALAALTQLS
jgi:hypothetical protein